MAKRKRRKINKYRGLRTCGAGNVKNRRGSGNRGGRGNAGMCKHKRTWAVKYAPNYFGKYGFVPPRKSHILTINLFEINRKILLNQIEKKDGKFYFEFKGKILGSGELSFPISIKAICWSKNAEEKIKKLGGKLTTIEKQS